MAHPIESFTDVRHGEIHLLPKALAEEDFIIKRRDSLFAYNLAVDAPVTSIKAASAQR